MERDEQKQPPIPKEGVDSREEILSEVKKQLRLVGPIVVVNLLLFISEMISVMFVGHLGELPLSGASMATAFASVTGFSLMIGMGSALDTFCGQSYGAKQYHMLGIYLQRAMLVLLLACIPLSSIWANAGRILLFFGQDPEIAAQAGSYARFLIPALFAHAILQCHIRFLQAQNNVVPMMLSAGFTTMLHAFICWILVFKSGLGDKGAALANSISYWVNAILLAVYIRVSPSCKKTWTGFSMEALHDIMKFVRLAIPSAIMVCLEIWSFEMILLLSGLLRNPKLETSVLSISLNTSTVVHIITLGLGGACYKVLTLLILFQEFPFLSFALFMLYLAFSQNGPHHGPMHMTKLYVDFLASFSLSQFSIRVSNELGAGRPRAARLALRVVVCLVVTEAVIVATILILGRHVWGYCYSKEETVVRYVGQMMILLAASHSLDGLQSVLSGTARGCGRQKLGALANLGAYYLLGIPVGVTLGFVCHIGGKGLWTGIIVALFAQALFLGIITLCTNWEKEAKKASDKAYSSIMPVEAFLSIQN